MMRKPKDVEEYISWFPEETQRKMEQMRATIKKAAPDAAEIISYSMPAYQLNGILVYFAAYANHIGFYPTGMGMAKFIDELTMFKTSKGTVQFPLHKELPIELITKIVAFRVAENQEKAKKSVKKKIEILKE